MKIDPLLSKAARLAKMRDYNGALNILKSEEDRYYGSFNYYYLFAVISLHTGAFTDALASFRQARQIKMKDPSTMLGIAVLFLKRMDTVQAVDYYLDVQEIDPKNRIAKKALAIIRRHSTPDSLSDWLTPERLAKLYPPIPFPAVTPGMVFAASLVLAAVVLLVYGIFVKTGVTPNPFNKNRDSRPTAEFVLSGQERSAPVETGGTYMYILTRDQATGLYDRALSLFTSYRDEAAKINLNRILESNASDGLKNKARLLVSYMEVPGFDTFKRSDNVSFADVKKEPAVYRDVHVIWSGMATNVEVTDDFTRFDFLVGYDTRRTLEGIVPVVFYGPFSINSERPLEVLGKITLSGAPLEIGLEGVAIHQTGRLENRQQ
jgi:tetratricopeptide (TPR) repeat protein